MVDPADVFTLENPQGQYPVFFQSATDQFAGMMSAADKAKLDSLSPGGGGYNLIQLDGVDLTQRTTLNVIGGALGNALFAEDNPVDSTTELSAPTVLFLASGNNAVTTENFGSGGGGITGQFGFGATAPGWFTVQNQTAVTGADPIQVPADIHMTGQFTPNAGVNTYTMGWHLYSTMPGDFSEVDVLFDVTKSNASSPDVTAMTLFYDGTNYGSRWTLVSGAFTPTLEIGNVDNGVWLVIIADDPGAYSNFYGTWASSANVSGPNDDVVILGHNLNSGGGQVDVTKGAVGISWESHFIGGHPQQEFHLISWPPNTVPAPAYVQTRFLSYEAHEDDGSTFMFLYAIDINIGSGNNSSDNPSIVINPTETHVRSPNQVATALFDDTGGGTITIATAGGTPAALNMNSLGVASLTSSAVGRLLDSRNSGNPSFQWDNGQAQILSPNNQTQISVQDSFVGAYINNALTMQLTPGLVFIPDKLLQVKRDAVGVETRGDTIASILVRNPTDATALAPQQYSPAFVMTGFGWTGAANRAVSFEMQVQPDGTGAGSFVWLYSQDEANYAAVASLPSFASGRLLGSTAQVSTVGAAGGASALPATPLGYFQAKLDDGSTVNVPYYNPA